MCSLWIVYYKHKFIIPITFFLSLSVFRFILNNINDIKYQLCYLKRCLCTQKLYLFIVTSFFLLLLVLFLCMLKIVYYCLKVFKMYLLYSWVWYINGFVTILPRLLLLVIQGHFFPEQL
jgi:hypothetical protein